MSDRLPQRRGSSLMKLALAAASVLLVLAAAEVGMRLAGVGEVMTYQPNARFGYLMRPSQRISTYGDVVEINSLGLRGPELRQPKPAGTRRVLFLGDSITYGGGHVPERELFCREFERLAAKDGVSVESVNVSAPGWSPQNWAAWVAENGLLDADLVVAVIPAIDRARPFATMEQHGMIERPPALRLASLWYRLEAARLPSVPLSDEALAGNVAAARSVAQRAGPRAFAAVFLPSRGADERPDRWAPFQAQFPDAVDLRTGFAARDFLDDVHFASPGHRAIALGIYAKLSPRLAP